MNTLTRSTFAVVIGALLFVPMSRATSRADDDDWEDRWEEFEDDWDDDDDGRWERHGWYRHRPYAYHEYYYGPRYYRHDGGPVYRDYYPQRRTYRYYDRYPRYYYGGQVQAGPVDVYYGRHGTVRVGPLHVFW
jgi:hypothetical protein